ncbi:hypothetical protein D3C87_35960 [compost metagenome]
MFKIIWLAISLAGSGFSAETLPVSGKSIDLRAGEQLKMRVNGHLTPCPPRDNEAKKCYLVQKGASIGMENWEVLQQPIEGFDYEEGYVYDLIVKVDVLQDKTGPDRFKHTLVQIISKIKES